MHCSKTLWYQCGVERAAASPSAGRRAGAGWHGLAKVAWDALIGFLCGRVSQARWVL